MRLLKLLRLLGIQAGEGQLAALSAAYALLIGFSQVWLKTIPISLFLTHFNIAALPFVYIVSAIVLVFAGSVYSAVEHKFPFVYQTYFRITLLALSFFLFWILLKGSSSFWIYPVLLVWSQAAFDMFELELWIMLNQLCTLDQAKRMFGTIGMCQTLAGVIGNLVLPIFLVFVGSVNIILGVSIAIFCALGLLTFIFNIYPYRFREVNIPITKEKKKEIVAKWYTNSYLVNNMLFATISLFIFTVVDILFYSASRITFNDEITLASFLGLFFAISNIIDLLGRGVLANVVINKLGIKMALFSRSTADMVIVVLILFLLPVNNILLIFLLCVLLKLIDEGVSNSVIRQAVLILYQPLFPKIRSWLQSRIELIVIPLSTIFASVSLIALQYYFDFSVFYISLLILFLTVIIIPIVYLLQKGFVANLKVALAQRRMQIGYNYLDKTYATFLLGKLAQGNSDEAIYCLNLLEELDHALFVKGIEICLSNFDSMTRYAALSKLQSVKVKDLEKEVIQKLQALIKEDPDDKLRANAFRAWMFQKNNIFDETLKPYLDTKEPSLLDEVLISALKYGSDPSIHQQAQQILTSLIHSNDPGDRLRAASILGKVESGNDFLGELLVDHDSGVVKEAIFAVAESEKCKFYPTLIKHLNIKEFRQTAALALIKIGDSALPLLEKEFVGKDDNNFALLIKIVGQIKTPSAIRLLLQLLLTIHDRVLIDCLVQSLESCEFHAHEELEKEMVEAQMLLEAEYLKMLLDFAKQLYRLKTYLLLFNTLMQQIKQSQRQLLQLLEFLYPKGLIKNIYLKLESSNLDQISYAMELLEQSLNKEHKKQYLYLIKEAQMPQMLPARSLANVRQVLMNILTLPTHEIKGIVKGMALYQIFQLKLREFDTYILALSADSNKLVSETANWILSKKDRVS